MIDIELKNMSTILAQLDDKAQDIIAIRTVNKVGAQGRTAAAKAIFEVYPIKKKGDFKKRIYYHRATKGNPAFVIRASKRWSRALSLTKFPSGQAKKTGAWAKPRGQKITYKRGFIRTMSSGHEGIFIRTGKDRYPIRELTGPTPGHLLNRPETKKAVQKRVNQQYRKVLMHEIQYYFSSKSRRGSRRRSK